MPVEFNSKFEKAFKNKKILKPFKKKNYSSIHVPNRDPPTRAPIKFSLSFLHHPIPHTHNKNTISIKSIGFTHVRPTRLHVWIT